MSNKLDIYKITIDPLYSEGGEDLGIDQIAFTSNPAILVKGMAFHSQQPTTKLCFSDDVKMRIAAPALIPMNIYRNDEMGEYYVQFTQEEIEKIFVKFMSQLNNSGKFNEEHDTSKTVPAFVLEAWLVGQDPKADRSYSTFGVEVPTGTMFMVAQVTDRKYYDYLVKNNQVGFSIEGFLGLKLAEAAWQNAIAATVNKSKTEQLNIKPITAMTKQPMKKFAATKLADAAHLSEGLTIVTTELAPGRTALVIDTDLEVHTDFTGELEVGEYTVTLEAGTISEVVERETVEEAETEMATEVDPSAKLGPNPEKKESEMAKKKMAEKDKMAMPKEEEKMAEKQTKMAIDETELMTILQPKFDEIYQMIADLKAAHEALMPKETEVVEEVEMSSVHSRFADVMKFLKTR